MADVDMTNSEAQQAAQSAADTAKSAGRTAGKVANRATKKIREKAKKAAKKDGKKAGKTAAKGAGKGIQVIGKVIAAIISTLGPIGISILCFLIIFFMIIGNAAKGDGNASDTTTNNGNDIVAIAQQELAKGSSVTEGGDTYWSWYGFDSYVAWCACFVSWCADQCGYIDSGEIPKYAEVNTGAQWFKDKGQYVSNSNNDVTDPEPGWIVFFDFDVDGTIDHTGIVEKVEGGAIYTIEGNTGYSSGSSLGIVGENMWNESTRYEIAGYGTYTANTNSGGSFSDVTASGDAAQQAWTYLTDGCGFTDEVAAGIIGNMMQECGGQTLDLDWDCVAYYMGSAYYGLFMQCLDYAPSGYGSYSIKEQIEYMYQNLESAFEGYGSNYNDITYDEFLKLDTREAAAAFCCVYERCGNYTTECNKRANFAETAYNTLHGS